MTIAQILQRFSDTSPVQFLHECVLSAKTVGAGKRKRHTEYTRVEFATRNMTPNDLLYYSRELGGGDARKPRYVGVIVWVPFDSYESATKVDAVDPSGGSEGTPTTRVSTSSSSSS